MATWIKKMWAWILGAYSFFTSEIFKVYVLPPLGTALYVVLAVVNKYDTAAIYLGALVACAAIAHTLVMLSKWRERSQVKDMLRFTGIFIGRDVSEDGSAVARIQIGAKFENHAPFPISYKIKKFRSLADDTVPSLGQILSDEEVVQPKSPGLYRDRPIVLKNPQAEFQGEMEFELIYGTPGRERYPMSRNLRIEFRYDPKEGVLHYPYLDAPKGKT